MEGIGMNKEHKGIIMLRGENYECIEERCNLYNR